MRTARLLSLVAITSLSAVAAPALAEPAVRVARIFSTQDGLSQFVELAVAEVPGAASKPVTWMKVTDPQGVLVKALPILPALLPAPGNHFTVAFDFPCRISCDFVPYGDTTADAAADASLLPTGGGSIELSGAGGVADTWTYPALPDDGRTMLDRDAGPVPAIFRSRLTPPMTVDAPSAYALEYVNAATGSYLVTSRADEVTALDGRRIPGWDRTGLHLDVLVRPSRDADSTATGAKSIPVCRFLFTGAAGYAHFFSGSDAECDALRASGARLESEAIFHLAEPDPVTGDCPVLPLDLVNGTRPVRTAEIYRFWDGGVDPPRHRLVASATARAEMLAKGWIPEGHGPRHVAFCQ